MKPYETLDIEELRDRYLKMFIPGFDNDCTYQKISFLSYIRKKVITSFVNLLNPSDVVGIFDNLTPKERRDKYKEYVFKLLNFITNNEISDNKEELVEAYMDISNKALALNIIVFINRLNDRKLKIQLQIIDND